MATDFPTKDEDKKISLRNSNYPQFDMDLSQVSKKMILISIKLVAILEVTKHLISGLKQEMVKKLLVLLNGLKKEKHGQVDILKMVDNSSQAKKLVDHQT